MVDACYGQNLGIFMNFLNRKCDLKFSVTSNESLRNIKYLKIGVLGFEFRYDVLSLKM